MKKKARRVLEYKSDDCPGCRAPLRDIGSFCLFEWPGKPELIAYALCSRCSKAIQDGNTDLFESIEDVILAHLNGCVGCS
jgi:hypothetical protein